MLLKVMLIGSRIEYVTLMLWITFPHYYGGNSRTKWCSVFMLVPSVIFLKSSNLLFGSHWFLTAGAVWPIINLQMGGNVWNQETNNLSQRLVMFLHFGGDGGAAVHGCFRSRENRHENNRLPRITRKKARKSDNPRGISFVLIYFKPRSKNVLQSHQSYQVISESEKKN